MSIASVRLLFPFAALLALGGCTQGEGELCQLDSDCASGLTCARPTNGQKDGTCRPPPTTPDMIGEDLALPPVLDMSVAVDMATGDLATSPDLTESGDLASPADLVPNG